MLMRGVLRALTVVAALLLLVALALPASAGHSHWLQTPGTCVVDIASGQTSLTEGGGFHQFHTNVHIGTAGTSLMDTGQVSVGKSDTGACP
jgi:hypothetical protein